MSGRPRSLLLDLTRLNEKTDDEDNEGPVYRAEIVLALEEAGIKKEEIYGLEAPWKNKYYVVFKSSQQRYSKIDKAVKIRDTYYHLKLPYPPQQTRVQKTRIRIYGYPLDEPTKNLETVLKQYGSFEAESTKDLTDWSVDLRTGIKELYMDIQKAVPSYITVGRYKVKISYMDQQQTCKKCHEPGHYGKECTEVITCKECGANDHIKKNCPQACCFGCGEIGHLSHQCPKDFPSIEEILEREKEEELKMQTTETPTIATWFDIPLGIFEEDNETVVDNTNKEEDEEINKTPKDPKEKDEETPETEKETPKNSKETEEATKAKETPKDPKKDGEKQPDKEKSNEKEKTNEDPKETNQDKRKDYETTGKETEEERTENMELEEIEECDHESTKVFETETNTEPKERKKESETGSESSEEPGFTEVRGKRKRFQRRPQSWEAPKRQSGAAKAKTKKK